MDVDDHLSHKRLSPVWREAVLFDCSSSEMIIILEEDKIQHLIQNRGPLLTMTKKNCHINTTDLTFDIPL